MPQPPFGISGAMAVDGKRQEVSVEKATEFILDECRMVLPGVQAIFGFQLIAVFNQGFDEKLSDGEQLLHLGALLLVAIAVALVMAPAALHRVSEPQSVSERFISLASNLLLASMFPLALGLCLDVYLVSSIIIGKDAPGVLIAIALLVLFFFLWIFLPRRERR